MKRIALGIIIGIIFFLVFVFAGGSEYLKRFGQKTEEAGEKLEVYEKEFKKGAEEAIEKLEESSERAKEAVKEVIEEKVKETVRETLEDAMEDVMEDARESLGGASDKPGEE